MAGLSDVLGYPTTEAELAPRLARLLASVTDTILVAEQSGQVVAWIHGAEQELLETGCRCEILGLVVDSACRRLGIGRHLLAAVESWARERGLPEVSVRSAIARSESHPFYERCGYARVKTQHVYRKPLTLSRGTWDKPVP
jgi:GNAT superfamily N-acetyltransferase